MWVDPAWCRIRKPASLAVVTLARRGDLRKKDGEFHPVEGEILRQMDNYVSQLCNRFLLLCLLADAYHCGLVMLWIAEV